jgi:methionine--tRNA ligase beta chain
MSIVCTVATQSPLCAAVQSVLGSLGAAVTVTATDKFTVTAPDGKAYAGLTTMMSVVGGGFKHPEVFGSNAAQRANIAQWVGLASHLAVNAASPTDAEVLFNDGNKYVAGTAGATLADATLLAAVGPLVVAAPKAYPKLFHWVRNVSKDALLAPVAPSLDAPAPDAAAAAASASSPDGSPKAAAAPKASASTFHKPTAEEIAARRIEKEKAKAEKEALKAASGEVTAEKKKPAALLSTDLDLRIGKIVAIDKHPSADRLYVESIDVGEAGPRTIVSGLVEHYAAEQLLNRNVLVICNLKPRALQGVSSHGMVLCASTEGVLSVVTAPAGDVAPGTRVSTGGSLAPASPPVHKKMTELLAKLRSDENGAVLWDTEPLSIPAGPLTSDVKNAIVK